MARNIRGACIRLGLLGLLGLLGPLGLLGMACEARSLDHGIGEMEMRFAQDAATAYCEVLLACDCPENWERYADEASCIEQESEYIAEVQRRAQEGGLQFDTECAAFTLGRWAEIGCDDFEAAALRLRPGSNSLFPSCRLYYGSVPEGEQCENAFGTIWNDCEQGSDCEEDDTRGSRCTALEPFQADPPGLGEPCVGGEPTARYSCEAPLYCAGMFQVETTTCQPYAGEGESCERTACAEGLLCDYGAGSTCRPPSPAGSPCSFVEFSPCGDDGYCDRGGIEATEGVCAPRLEPGATCVQPDACGEGSCSCDPYDGGPCEGTCIPNPPSYPIMCEPGFAFAPRDRF